MRRRGEIAGTDAQRDADFLARNPTLPLEITAIYKASIAGTKVEAAELELEEARLLTHYNSLLTQERMVQLVKERVMAFLAQP